MPSLSHHVGDNVTAKGDNVRRLAVVACDRRRRSWTVEAKLAIIAESYSTRTSISEVARRHGINRNQLFAWRGQFRRGDFGEPVLNSFVPVTLSDPGPPIAAPAPAVAAPRPDTVIEVVIGAATVRVPPTADEAMVRRVLAAVKSLR